MIKDLQYMLREYMEEFNFPKLEHQTNRSIYINNVDSNYYVSKKHNIVKKGNTTQWESRYFNFTIYDPKSVDYIGYISPMLWATTPRYTDILTATLVRKELIKIWRLV